jgi:hypothetical protein
VTIRGTELIIDVVDDRSTTVKVLEGTVELSDPDGSKTVRIGAGESSTVELDGLPSDPVAFDPGTIDRWWEEGRGFQLWWAIAPAVIIVIIIVALLFARRRAHEKDL